LIDTFHHFIYHSKQKYYDTLIYQRFYYFDKIIWSLTNRRKDKYPKEFNAKIIAITVSVNYTEVLAYVIEQNKNLFTEWIIVTDLNDIRTVALLKQYPEITTLYFNFKKHGNKFNKGGGIRMAQKHAYKKYPNDWYLIIDSDISIRSAEPLNLISHLDENAIYFCNNRRDFLRWSDVLLDQKFEFYRHDMRAGFFQLYLQKKFYIDWPTASRSDIKFTDEFTALKFLPGIVCDHLGQSGNHDGSKGPGFIFD
jgi:hypothetical protein